MKCPTCKEKQVKIGDPEFPFCTERCRLIDLGAWASEKFVISTPLKPEDLEDIEQPGESRPPRSGW